jgi:hypothetical protein
VTAGQQATVGDLGRQLLDGTGDPAKRLQAAAQQAAGMVARGEVDRTSAVTVLYVAAMAAGVPSGEALEQLAGAMRTKTGTP